MTRDIVINEQELNIIIDALQYRSGEIKHGRGSNWQDYYLVYEPIIQKIIAVSRGSNLVVNLVVGQKEGTK